MIILIYSIFVSIVWIILMIYLLSKLYSIKQLKNQPIVTVQPSVAIIVAVRNEEEDLEKALQSLCNINYKNHRLIVANAAE